MAQTAKAKNCQHTAVYIVHKPATVKDYIRTYGFKKSDFERVALSIKKDLCQVAS